MVFDTQFSLIKGGRDSDVISGGGGGGGKKFLLLPLINEAEKSNQHSGNRTQKYWKKNKVKRKNYEGIIEISDISLLLKQANFSFKNMIQIKPML